ncbi:MAG: GNAT family N-acetyltransferase [Candidatus Helarchaeota archaeon]|nr:GNAT family N-acetyltransferase [Candidatus Helarchaeota archaeon]
MSKIKIYELTFDRKTNPHFARIQTIFADAFSGGCILLELEIARVRQKLRKKMNEKFHLIGAIKGEELVGFGFLKFFREFSYGPYVVVDKNCRGQGIGTLIIDKIIQLAKIDAESVHILNPVILFEVEKIAFDEATQWRIKQNVKLYRKLNFLQLDIEYLSPVHKGWPSPQDLWIIFLSDQDSISSSKLLHYINLLYQFEYSLKPNDPTGALERYLKIVSDSINGREKISRLPD